MGPAPDKGRSPDELLAEVYREFRDGLAGRVEALRATLERLAGGYDASAADTFYRTAHTLKGTAASFEADELVEPAKGLAEVGLRWLEGGDFDPLEVAAAFRQLEELEGGVQRYMERVEGDALG
ncbi:MAG: Hpt domain-containing protein [Gemmatimonadales bacterium]|jgi:HPt (histidine-containing phosphotransfer) domain-containing protein